MDSNVSRLSGEKIQIVDLTRTFSILAVWMYHYYHLRADLSVRQGWMWALWHRFSVNGGYGVQVFFVISGFLITRLIASRPGGLFKPDYRNFYSRRLGRIIPLLVLVLILGILVRAGMPGYSTAFAVCLKLLPRLGWFFWISMATFCLNWYKFFGGPFNGLHWDVLWSLSIEEQFYLFFPLCLKKMSSEKNLHVFLWFFILLGPMVRLVGVWKYPDNPYWNSNSFAQFELIAIGSLLYLFSERYRVLLGENQAVCWFFCLAGGFILFRTFWELPTDFDYFRKIFSFSFIGWGTFLFLSGGINIKLFDSKYLAPFALPGKLSYGGYLFHSLVLYFLWPLISNKVETVGFPVFAISTLLVAALSYRFYEVPANLWVRRWAGSR
jgi:peptidoglycan/LPS O-acetylase OafA/YrhL